MKGSGPNAAAALATAIPARTAPGKATQLPATAGDPLVEAGSLQVVGDAGFVLTGSITPNGTTTYTIHTPTPTVKQLKPGDRVTINATTITVISITSAAVFVGDAAVGAGAADTTPDVLPCIESHVDNTGVLVYVRRSDGVVEFRNGAIVSAEINPSTGSFKVGNIGGGGSSTTIEFGNTTSVPYYVETRPYGTEFIFGKAAGRCPVRFASYTRHDPLVSLTATGTVQSDAYACGMNDLYFFGTVAAGAGAKLPTAIAGRKVWIYNGGANPLKIWPFLGDDLGAGVDAVDPALLMPGEGRWYYAQDATNWVSSYKRRSTAEGLTATGTVIGDAYPLIAEFSEFTTTPAGTGCVALASHDKVRVLNLGANALLFYPPTGATVDGAASASIAATATGKFVRLSATRWFTE